MATDIRNWEINVQIFLDLLISKDGIPGSVRSNNEKQFVEFHLAIEELLYKDEFVRPRIAGGNSYVTFN